MLNRELHRLGASRDSEIVGEQQAISVALGALDDKIALNDRIAATSRQLALAYGERTLSIGDSHDAELGRHVEVTRESHTVARMSGMATIGS